VRSNTISSLRDIGDSQLSHCTYGTCNGRIPSLSTFVFTNENTTNNNSKSFGDKFLINSL